MFLLTPVTSSDPSLATHHWPAERSIHMTHGEQNGTAAACTGPYLLMATDLEDVELHVLGCRLTYKGQTVTSAEARFIVALRSQKPPGLLGRGAQDRTATSTFTQLLKACDERGGA